MLIHGFNNPPIHDESDRTDVSGSRSTPDRSTRLFRYGPHDRFPKWAFDAGLRPDPFPDQAASLLPGLLAVTRTGLTPASDDELRTRTSPHSGHLLVTGRTGCSTRFTVRAKTEMATAVLDGWRSVAEVSAAYG